MPGPNAPYTQLDAQQVIRQSFDEANDRLRVETAATIVAGAVEVSTTSTKDSIAIGNQAGTNFLAVNPDGSINVDISSGPPVPVTPKLNYNEVTGVASGIETSVVTYTAPVGKTAYLMIIGVAGTNNSEHRIYQNASVIDKKYTTFGAALNSDFDYRNDNPSAPGFLLSVGDVITVKVLQSATATGTFNAKIQVVEFG